MLKLELMNLCYESLKLFLLLYQSFYYTDIDYVFLFCRMEELKQASPWDVFQIEEFLYFCCPECDERNQSKELFIEHAYINHPNAVEYLQSIQEPSKPIELDFKEEEFDNFENDNDICDNLDQGFEDECSDVVKHEINEKPIQNDQPSQSFAKDQFLCELCNEKFEMKQDHATHDEDCHKIIDENDDQDEKYYCNRCDKYYSGRKGFRYHCQLKHSVIPKINHGNVGPKTCAICNETFAGRVELKKHDDTVHLKTDQDGNQKFFCEPCDQWFENKGKFRDHVLSSKHTEPKQKICKRTYDCGLCEIKFPNPKTLQTHENEIHTIIDDKGQKKLQCSFCFECFNVEQNTASHQNNFRRHVKIMHVEKGHKCTFCEKTFGRKLLLKNHINTSHADKVLKCDQCDKQFKHRHTLKHHILEYHEGETHQCHLCGKSGFKKAALSSHIRCIHEGKNSNKSVKCLECDRTFANKEYMLIHYKGIHQNILEHTCEQCGKGFMNPHVLKKHIRKIHENERNFKCHICPKAFFNQWGLTNHVNGVHLNIRNYECTICGDKFKKSIHLKTHIKLKHKMDLTHKEVLELTSQKPKNE